MHSSPAISRVCGVNASLTEALAQSKMSANPKITAAMIANINFSDRRTEPDNLVPTSQPRRELRRGCGSSGGWRWVCRPHLDIRVEPDELQSVVDALVKLNGTVVAVYQRFTTLADPEGNELCITAH